MYLSFGWGLSPSSISYFVNLSANLLSPFNQGLARQVTNPPIWGTTGCPSCPIFQKADLTIFFLFPVKITRHSPSSIPIPLSGYTKTTFFFFQQLYTQLVCWEVVSIIYIKILEYLFPYIFFSFFLFFGGGGDYFSVPYACCIQLAYFFFNFFFEE